MPHPHIYSSLHQNIHVQLTLYQLLLSSDFEKGLSFLNLFVNPSSTAESWSLFSEISEMENNEEDKCLFQFFFSQEYKLHKDF